MRKIIQLLAVAGFVALTFAAPQNSLKQKLAERAAPKGLIQSADKTTIAAEEAVSGVPCECECYCKPPCLINKCLDSHEIKTSETELEVEQELEIKQVPDIKTIRTEASTSCSKENECKKNCGNGKKTRNFCINGNICVEESICEEGGDDHEHNCEGCEHKTTVIVETTEAACLDDECYKLKVKGPLEYEECGCGRV